MSDSISAEDFEALAERVDALEQENSELRSRLETAENRLDHYQKQMSGSDDVSKRISGVESRLDSVENRLDHDNPEGDGGEGDGHGISWGSWREQAILDQLDVGECVTEAAVAKMYKKYGSLVDAETVDERTTTLLTEGPFHQVEDGTYELVEQ